MWNFTLFTLSLLYKRIRRQTDLPTESFPILMRTPYFHKASHPRFTSPLEMKQLTNRYSQSMWHLIYSQPPDYPPGTISAQVQIRASEKQESPRRAGGLYVSRRAKKALKITHLCFCQAEDNEENLNLSFKGNQNQALWATPDTRVQKVNRERWYLSDYLEEIKLKIPMRCIQF